MASLRIRRSARLFRRATVALPAVAIAGLVLVAAAPATPASPGQAEQPAQAGGLSAAASVVKRLSDRAEGRHARIALPARRHRPGETVRIAGQVPIRFPSPVLIRFRADGVPAWRAVRAGRASRTGRFRASIPAKRNGRLQVLPRFGEPSRTHTIRVRSQVGFRVSDRHLDLGDAVKLLGRSDPGGRRKFKVVAEGPAGAVSSRLTNRRGRSTQTWKPSRPGTYTLRAFAGRNATADGAAGPRRKVTVYRPAHASWYGPGFYGGRTACGQTLTSATIGVAHKTLPCGTKLMIRNGSHRVRVPVIDRAPDIPGRELDLTYATKSRLGFGDSGTVMIDR